MPSIPWARQTTPQSLSPPSFQTALSFFTSLVLLCNAIYKFLSFSFALLQPRTRSDIQSLHSARIIGARKKEEDLKAKTSPQELISRAAIVGIGVDMLYLPRLRQLLARHAARLKRATSSTSPAAVTIEQTAQTISGAGAIASSRLARRILHDDELKELTARSSILPAKEKNGTPLDEEAQLRFLAVR